MSHKAVILDHLKRYGSISPLEARGVYGIERLAARILDLKADGHRISTRMKRDAMGHRYAEYVIDTGDTSVHTRSFRRFVEEIRAAHREGCGVNLVEAR